jgi:superfamily II DNA/RNA helicase
MAPEITRITQEFLHNPVRVEVARQATTSETIDQFVVRHTPRRKDTADAEKREVLRRLIRDEGDSLTNGIIFCNRKRDVDVVAKSLKRHGFNAEAMHGDLDQKLRMSILQRFRDGDLKLLIASDVAARGLDIPNVSHIFNFDVPIHSEDYVHRIGRTGRAGRSGKSLTLCLPFEEKYLAHIEELVKKAIPVMPSPLAADDSYTPTPREPSRPRSERGERSRGRRSEPRPEARTEPRPEPRTEARPEPAPEPRASEPAAPEPRAAEPRSPRGRREAAVPGMGDHVPAFLLRELRIDSVEAEPEPEPEAAPEPQAPEAAEPAPAPRRRSRARSRTEADAA